MTGLNRTHARSVPIYALLFLIFAGCVAAGFTELAPRQAMIFSAVVLGSSTVVSVWIYRALTASRLRNADRLDVDPGFDGRRFVALRVAAPVVGILLASVFGGSIVAYGAVAVVLAASAAIIAWGAQQETPADEVD